MCYNTMIEESNTSTILEKKKQLKQTKQKYYIYSVEAFQITNK